MTNEEKEAIEELKRTIKNSNYCDSIGTGQIEIVLNYIDKLQKEVQYEKNEKMNLAGMLDEKDEEIKSLETDLEIGNNICAKLQKENEQLKTAHRKNGRVLFTIEAINERYISKDKIKEALGDENIPDEMILTYIETLVSENNRLEDIEDRKVQIEYNNVFNKGVKSVEDKIRTKLEHAIEVLKNLDNEQDILVQKIVIYYLEKLLGDDE